MNVFNFIKSRSIVAVVFSVIISFGFVAFAVNGATTISTNISTGGTLSVTGASTLTGNVTAAGTLGVTGLTTMIQASSTRLSVTDTAYFGGTATSSFTSAGVLTLTNGETIGNATDGTVLFSRDTDATVTLMAADSSGATDLTIDTTGAGAIVIGSADVTSLTITTDSTGTGEVVLPLQSIAGAEMVNDTVTATQLSATLTFADADLVDFGSVSITDATEGLILPQHATDCSSSGTAEGQVCWEADDDTLYIGDGTTVAVITPNTSSNNTWTGTNDFTLAGAENIGMTHDLATDLTTTEGVLSIKVTPSSTSGVYNGIYVSQEDSANTEPLDVGIEIHNVDTDLALATGILFTSAAGGVTSAIDASGSNITNALSFGANAIDGTYFDIAGTTGAVTLTQQTVATSPFTITGIDDGTAAMLDLNVHNVSGTLIDIDYTAETLTGDLTGADLDLNTNVTAAADFDVTGVNVQTPALTAADTAVTTTYTGYNISAAGALDVTEGANAAVINWRGLNVTMPAIDSGTGDTVSATGILISAGTVTAGAGTETSVGVDVSDSDIVSAVSVGDNPITGGTWNLNAATALTLGDALTGDDGATVAIFSSDWEISATGVMTGIGAITSNGTFTTTGEAILTGEVNLGAVSTFTDSDATPDVSGAAYWNTNTSAVTITDFDGAGLSDGDVIVVVSKGAITYDVTTSGIICGTTDIITADNDVTTFIYDGTDWRCTARIDVSDDIN